MLQAFEINFKELNRIVTPEELMNFIDTHYFGEIEIKEGLIR